MENSKTQGRKSPETIGVALSSIRTRGAFRALSERAAQGEQRMNASSLPPDSPVWDAWEAIKGAYPLSTTNWDEEPPLIWFATLGDLSADQILNGLRNLGHHRDAKGGTDFPPNVIQFRDLCMANFQWESAAQRIDFTGVAQIEDLTAKERRIEIGRENMANIMSQFGRDK